MIIADTGFWLALANRRDAYHAVAQKRIRQLDEPLISTWPVLTETCQLLLSWLGTDAELRFIAGLTRGVPRVLDLETKHMQRIGDLMEKYRDLPVDLADASLVILAEQLGHGRILSTDARDFQAYRWKDRAPFENLLLAGR